VNVLVSVGGEPAALAAKAATSAIPTVSTIGSDPVRLGLAAIEPRPKASSTLIVIPTAPSGAIKLEAVKVWPRSWSMPQGWYNGQP
jgi:putative ABC transport system substrate-binding protein